MLQAFRLIGFKYVYCNNDSTCFEIYTFLTMINTSFSDIQVIGELIKNCTFYNDGVDQLKLSPILEFVQNEQSGERS